MLWSSATVTLISFPCPVLSNPINLFVTSSIAPLGLLLTTARLPLQIHSSATICMCVCVLCLYSIYPYWLLADDFVLVVNGLYVHSLIGFIKFYVHSIALYVVWRACSVYPSYDDIIGIIIANYYSNHEQALATTYNHFPIFGLHAR